MTFAEQSPEICAEEDTLLRKWTFVRYIAMGAIMMYRVYIIRRTGKDQGEQARISPYRDHPTLTNRMNNSSLAMSVILAGCIFIQSEGVGFTIYFSASACMDNFAIYFVKSGDFCQYVTQVALYSMALVTFLPTCAIAYFLQARWYDGGQWIGTKTAFVVIMAAATVASFLARLFLVYGAGWVHFVQRLMESTSYKVTMAMLVPPLVDALQTGLLIAASLKSNHASHDHLYEDVNPQSTLIEVEGSCDEGVTQGSHVYVNGIQKKGTESNIDERIRLPV